MSVSLQARHLRIPMKARMKQASFERKTGDSIWVEARRGDVLGLGEGCPRPYVTEETSESALKWLAERQPELERELTSFEALRAWVDAHSAELDLHNGAWCAVELALLDLFAREKGCTVEALLGVPETRDELQYTAVVSDESGEALDKLLGRYLGVGFSDFKFKLSGEHAADEAKLARFEQLRADAPGPVRVRLDCNNVWGADVERAEAELERLGATARSLPGAARGSTSLTMNGEAAQLSGEAARLSGDTLPAEAHRYFAVEEPLTARRAADLSRLSTSLGVAIVLDESLCRVSDVALYRDLPGEWIANVKVSKAGGLLRALSLIAAAKTAGWKVIIGAQVAETSVLTRAGIIAARAASDALLAVEGGFGTLLLEEDLTEPVLMFGFGGKLTLSEAVPTGAPGLGLTRNTSTGGMAP